METFIAVVIILGLLISIHELGHLMLAKRAGILCREYAIGFGPKLFSVKKGETVYTLRLLPIGGYVRMAGEDPEIVCIKPGHRIGLFFNPDQSVSKIIVNRLDRYPDAKVITAEHADLEKDLVIQGYEEDEGSLMTLSIDRQAEYVMDGQSYQIAPLDRQFASKPLFDRILTIFAGPFMNFVLALVIFVIYFAVAGYPSNQPILGEIMKGKPADQVHLQKGDKVLKINGQAISSFTELTKIIQENPNTKLTFTIERNGKIFEKTLTTAKTESGEGIIGVYGPTDKSVIGSIQHGFTETYQTIKLELMAFKQLITGKIGLDQLSGPVGIYSMTGEVVKGGIYWVMRWTAILSINLGIVNLLPLPALDGGRLMFLFLEGLRGKPVDPKRETLVHFIGFAFLMLVMILVTWNDIQKFLM